MTHIAYVRMHVMSGGRDLVMRWHLNLDLRLLGFDEIRRWYMDLRVNDVLR